MRQVWGMTDYSDGCLPAGTPDDISWGNIWRGDICRVEEGAVVGVVLTQSPFCGILDGLLTFQLRKGDADETNDYSGINAAVVPLLVERPVMRTLYKVRWLRK